MDRLGKGEVPPKFEKKKKMSVGTISTVSFRH